MIQTNCNPNTYLLEGMLEEVVIEAEYSRDDVFGPSEKVEVAHFVWQSTGTNHIVHILWGQLMLEHG